MGAAIYELGDRPRAYADGILCHILVERGELAAARRALERNVDTGDASDGARHWLHAELALLVAEGRSEEAVAAAERFARRFEAYRDSPGSPWRLLCAEALDRLGRTDEALVLAREELAAARRFGAPAAVGRALRVLGRLERDAGVDAARGGGRRAARLAGAARARQGAGGARLRAAPRAAADRRARAAARGARARGGVRRARAGGGRALGALRQPARDRARTRSAVAAR